MHNYDDYDVDAYVDDDIVDIDLIEVDSASSRQNWINKKVLILIPIMKMLLMLMMNMNMELLIQGSHISREVQQVQEDVVGGRDEGRGCSGNSLNW